MTQTGPGPQIVTRPGADADRLPHLPPLLARIYAARGIVEAADVDHALAGLHAPDTLPDIQRAGQRLARAVMEDERILVVGDFDADGATSVALALTLLRALGAAQVEFMVPNRFDFGYGLSPEIVDLAARRQPAVLVTVDNGVSSVAGVARANEHGIDVIVTDHHLPGDVRPDAYAIVNPNLPESAFPSRSVAGVGVIFYVLSVVRSELRERGWFAGRDEPKMAEWLDLVALGTVADVVPLDRNNRIFIEQGLKRIRGGRARPGIRALCEVARRDAGKLTAADLGFALGPRLNAAGRLDDMSLGIRCLTAADPGSARELTTALDELNRARRQLQEEMVSDAELLVAGHDVAVEDRYGVCVYDANWHQGVVGIVAGRLREKLHRPVIAFAEAGDLAPDELKGSARSLPDLHVRDALDAVATRYPGMLVNFGGHAMAAGLTLKRVHYEAFARAFDAEVRRVLPAESLQAVIVTDGRLEDEELSLDVARLLAAAGPWGQGFPEPCFHDEFTVVSQRVVGESHLKLVLKRGERLFDAIAFNQPPLPDVQRVAAVFRLSENDYGALPTLQLMVEHLVGLA